MTTSERFGFATDLLRRGASDYLNKPFSNDDLLYRIHWALELRPPPVVRKPPAMAALSSAEVFLSETMQRDLLPGGSAPEELMIGRSEPIQKVLEQVRWLRRKTPRY